MGAHTLPSIEGVTSEDTKGNPSSEGHSQTVKGREGDK
jgi:hypothetical protein